MEDNRIIDLFFERSEQAIAELDTKYGKLCRRIACNIVGDARDAEECVNDAYLGVWNTIPPQRPQILSSYLCRIVRNRAISRHESNTALKRSGYEEALDELSFALQGSSRAEDELAVRELTALLERFLRTLPRRDRVLFMRRYWYGDAVKDIATQLRLSPHTVTVRLSRIREKLTHFAQKEGVIL